MMSAEEFKGLKEDIEENGQLEPILIDAKTGTIIDGRNRYEACLELDIIPVCEPWEGDDPVSFVVSKNLHRRQLSESQRGMVAARIANLKRGRPELNISIDLFTQPDAAKALNVSVPTVKRAKEVLAEGAPSLVQAVDSGEVAVSTAATLTALPKEEQAEVVAKGRSEILRMAKELTKAHVSHNSGENEWYTPEEIIHAARSVLQVIDLDPASSTEANNIVNANKYYTKEDDGLNQTWLGKIWLNPPYAQPLINDFCSKLCTEILDGNVTEAIVLVNNATETKWFNTLSGISKAICFPQGRVRFWSPGKSSATPLQGQAILYFGKQCDRFYEYFSELGKVWFDEFSK